MKLKKLTLQGFKSFADRTELSFDEGLTGIIGPNGCGKSNVVDAVKWVLGDQRPTSLRGKEMIDVIFGGAQGRAPMGAAEVMLLLERDPHPDEEAMGQKLVETQIGRRLFRSGESEYLLNGRVVRLKDVKEALLDTGLGVGGYSVMEQGKIDAVLSANPEDRRNIFDEAAGISRYKLRRKEALRKLDRTEANLARISDVRQEKASRVRSLKIQATKARNYREAEARLRALRVGVACLDSMNYRDLLGGASTRLAEAEARVEEAELRRDESRQQQQERDELRHQLLSRRNQMRDLLAELRSEERSRRESIEGGESRLRGLEQLRQRSSEDHARVHEGLETDRMALEELVEQGQDVEARLEALDEMMPRLEEEARQAKRELREARTELDRARELLLTTLHERTRARNAVQSESHEIQSLKDRRDRLDRERGELASKLEGLRAERRRERLILWDLEERRARLEELQELLGARIEAHRGEKKAVASELERLRHERSSLRSQQSVLQELEASHQGLDEAARELLDGAAEGAGGVLGSLVERLECPAALGAALEAVLGSRVQALLLEDFDAVQRALAVLDSGANKGQLVLLDASLAAADSAGSGEGASGAGEDPLESFDEGALCQAGIELQRFVRVDESVRAFVAPLLRGVWVVPDLETARSILQEGGAAGEEGAELRPRICVTPRGELLEGAWVRAGRAEASAGLVQRRARLSELAEEIERVEARLEEYGALESEWDDRLGRDERQRQRLDRFAQAMLRRETAMQQSMRVRLARESELLGEIENAEDERVELRRQRSACFARLQTPLINSWLLERRMQRAEDAQQQHTDSAREFDAKVQETQAQLSEQQTQRAGLEAEQSGNAERRSILQRKLEEAQGRIEELETILSNAAEEQTRLETSLEDWRREHIDLACRANFVEDISSEFDKELAELEANAEAARNAVREAEAQFDEARNARQQLVIDKREAEFKLKQLDDEMREQFDIELARLRGEVQGRGLWLPGPFIGPAIPASGELHDRFVAQSLQGPLLPPNWYEVEDTLPRLWLEADFDRRAVDQEIAALRNRMQRMGAVNLAAEGELAEAEEEFETLEKDCRDLEESRKQLMETLKRINLESRALFEETFHKARANFQDIFRMLFQGGNADIKLVESDDPLEAGIDIYAKPPGKELQSIRAALGW
jgi:chromosome segregation protein